MSPANGETPASPRQSELDDEVTTLSTKLINAINHQTTLDDNLSAARMELDKSQDRIRQLETQVEEQREMLAGHVWVKRTTMEAEKAKLALRVAEEKRARLDMEQQKRKIEQELENLTAALFEEANKMVISAKEEARAEQEAVQRKNDQLRAQLDDTEGLLRSQQEQLVELKRVMEQMTVEREEQSPPTVPSSPGFETFDARDAARASVGTHHQSLSVPLSPTYPTSLTHLLQPVLRTDLAAFGDFRELVRTSKRLSTPRLPSGSSGSGGFASLAIGLGSASSHVSAGNGSTSSFATIGSPAATSPQTPNTPASYASSGLPAAPPTPLPPLKETKFYKRVLTEDIEPTLRLDTAPGLSWLARRSVVASMTDGSLVVEPTPSTATGRFGKVIKPELYPCSLCGEARKDDESLLRTHRFRISESDTTQVGHPLCKYCLGRVRSTCEFLGFLRIVKDGHWRADDEDAEKAAWEESVRLREQMFWSRIGGGVVPTGHVRHPSTSSVAPSLRGEKSPRPSHDGSSTTLEPVKQFLELPRSLETTPQPSVEDATAAEQPVAVEEKTLPAPPVDDAAEIPAAEESVAAEVPVAAEEKVLPAPPVDSAAETTAAEEFVDAQEKILPAPPVDDAPEIPAAEGLTATEGQAPPAPLVDDAAVTTTDEGLVVAEEKTLPAAPDDDAVEKPTATEEPVVVAEEQTPPARRVDNPPTEQDQTAKPAPEGGDSDPKPPPLATPMFIAF